MKEVPKHKVFISYYHEDDQEYKNRLVQALSSKIVDKSVSPGDIHDTNLSLAEIRRRIRDDHIADATVTIVLIGPCTWQRKHVDWEISASIVDRRNNERVRSHRSPIANSSRLSQKATGPKSASHPTQVGEQSGRR